MSLEKALEIMLPVPPKVLLHNFLSRQWGRLPNPLDELINFLLGWGLGLVCTAILEGPLKVARVTVKTCSLLHICKHYRKILKYNNIQESVLQTPKMAMQTKMNRGEIQFSLCVAVGVNGTVAQWKVLCFAKYRWSQVQSPISPIPRAPAWDPVAVLSRLDWPWSDSV